MCLSLNKDTRFRLQLLTPKHLRCQAQCRQPSEPLLPKSLPCFPLTAYHHAWAFLDGTWEQGKQNKQVRRLSHPQLSWSGRDRLWSTSLSSISKAKAAWKHLTLHLCQFHWLSPIYRDNCPARREREREMLREMLITSVKNWSVAILRIDDLRDAYPHSDEVKRIRNQGTHPNSKPTSSCEAVLWWVVVKDVAICIFPEC